MPTKADDLAVRLVEILSVDNPPLDFWNTCALIQRIETECGSTSLLEGSNLAALQALLAWLVAIQTQIRFTGFAVLARESAPPAHRSISISVSLHETRPYGQLKRLEKLGEWPIPTEPDDGP